MDRLKALHKLYNQRGVTLIELIITLAIMGFVAMMAFSIISFSNKVLQISEKEYDFQYETRSVLENTSQIVRYSTALFTIPASSFREDNLAKGWDYIGIREVEISPGVFTVLSRRI